MSDIIDRLDALARSHFAPAGSKVRTPEYVTIMDASFEICILRAELAAAETTCDALSAARQEGRQEGREEAAKVCDEMAAAYADASKSTGFEVRNAYRARSTTATYAADAIRSLPAK